MDQSGGIPLNESSYGARQSAIIVVTFTSFLELRNAIRARRWRRSGENPGQVYGGDCELLHIHHGDFGREAVLKCSTLWDI